MSDEPEQIEISMDEPEKTQKEPEVEVIKAEEARASKEIDPQEGMEALRAQLEREKAARIEAEKRANEHANSAAKAKNEVQDTNLHLVNNAIEQVKQNSEFLKSQYAAAMSAGCFPVTGSSPEQRSPVISPFQSAR